MHRINAIYFLRQYSRGTCETSRTHLEIHAFNSTVVSQPEFLTSGPLPEPPEQVQSTASKPANCAVSLVVHSADGELNGKEDDEMLYDWSTAGGLNFDEGHEN